MIRQHYISHLHLLSLFSNFCYRMRLTPSSGIPLAACWPPALTTWPWRSVQTTWNMFKIKTKACRPIVFDLPIYRLFIYIDLFPYRSGVWSRTRVSMTSRPIVKKSTLLSGALLALGPTTPTPTSCWPGETAELRLYASSKKVSCRLHEQVYYHVILVSYSYGALLFGISTTSLLSIFR